MTSKTHHRSTAESAGHPRPASSNRRSPLAWAFFLMIAVQVLGLLLTWRAARLGFDTVIQGGDFNIFFVLLVRYEPVALALGLVTLSGLALLLARAPRACELRLPKIERKSLRRLILGLAFGVTLLAAWGSVEVFQGHRLSMDEYGVHFQSRIFAAGEIFVPIPERWQPWAEAATPVFVALHEDPPRWTSHYLPVYAAMLAALSHLEIDRWLNPVFAALSVLWVAAVARRLYPDDASAPWIAALFLATTPQFLVTSMSFYTLPAHLGLNLLWLALYLRDGRAVWWVPWIGVAAMGLHQYVMHSVFALPFLLQWVADRRYRLVAYGATVYLGGLAGWSAWLRATRPDLDADLLDEAFGLPDADHFFVRALDAVLLVSWQSVAVAVLAILAVLCARRLPRAARLLAWSVVTTFAFYFFYARDQGHGWGYRYAYPALGNLVLLATWGANELGRRLGRARAHGLVALALAATVALQMPLRLVEVAEVVAPFAAAERLIAEQDEEVILIDGKGTWYGQDLVRNDPLFERGPVVMNGLDLDPDQLRALRRSTRVEKVTPAQFGELGLPVLSDRPEGVRIGLPESEP